MFLNGCLYFLSFS